MTFKLCIQIECKLKPLYKAYFYFCVYACVHLCVCVEGAGVNRASGGQKRESYLLDLELWVLLSFHVGPRTQTWVLQEQHILLMAESSFQFLIVLILLLQLFCPSYSWYTIK